MTHREKVLAGAVAASVALWGATSGYQRFRAAVEASDALAARAAAAKEDAEFALARGERAKMRLNDWAKRSLPTDRDVAKSLYQDWVRTQLTAAGLTVEQLVDRPVSRRETNFGELSLEARASGTLEQFTDFLYKFYAAPHLHRISTTTLTPSENGQKVTAIVGIDALILADATRKAELASGDERKLARTVDEYKSTINGRNLFAPHTPGSGPDAGLANSAKVSTIMSDGLGGYHVWITTENPPKTHKFKTGDKVEFGTFTGTLIEIDMRHAVIETANGKVEVKLGQTLGQATPVEAKT
jgi:hypothetical protein